MQATSSVAVSSPAVGSLTVRQFSLALRLVLAVVAFGCVLYGVETGLLGLRQRLVANPVDVMMRAVGLAHFLVGWLFLFSSRRLRSWRAIGRLSAATAVGALICLAFARLDGTQNLVLIVLFYGLFLIHEVGDEGELFLAYGDGPEPSPESRALLASLSRAVALLLIAVLALGQLAFVTAIGKTDVLERLPMGTVLVGLGAVLVACALASYQTVRLWRRLYGQMRTVLALYQPLFLVYAGLLAILLLGSLLGSVGLNLVILVHVAAWLVSAHYHLGKRPALPTSNPWKWLRATPCGFLVLHAGVALGVLLLMGLRVYSWERSGFVCDMLSKSSFYYWSIMHIFMAWGRPR